MKERLGKGRRKSLLIPKSLVDIDSFSVTFLPYNYLQLRNMKFLSDRPQLADKYVSSPSRDLRL